MLLALRATGRAEQVAQVDGVHGRARLLVHGRLRADPEVDLPVEAARVVDECLEHDVAVALVEFAVERLVYLVGEEFLDLVADYARYVADVFLEELAVVELGLFELLLPFFAFYERLVDEFVGRARVGRWGARFAQFFGLGCVAHPFEHFGALVFVDVLFEQFEAFFARDRILNGRFRGERAVRRGGYLLGRGAREHELVLERKVNVVEEGAGADFFLHFDRLGRHLKIGIVAHVQLLELEEVDRFGERVQSVFV